MSDATVPRPRLNLGMSGETLSGERSPRLTLGAWARDTYTDRIGQVIALDWAAGRCTVALLATAWPAYTITGCQSWFEPAEEA